MKYLIGLILSLINSTAMAEAIPFPPCTINNQPVSYISVTSDFNNSYAKHGRVYVAGSDIVNGRGVIDYNSTLLSTKPTEWNLQVILHECAHLKLHAHKKHNLLTKEYEADCHSASVLKNKYGYKDEEFDIITQTMKEFLPRGRIYAFRQCVNR